METAEKESEDKNNVNNLPEEMIDLLSGKAKKELNKETKKKFILDLEAFQIIILHKEFERQPRDQLKTRQLSLIHI